MEATTKNFLELPVPLQLWPPSQDARRMLVELVAKRLSSPSLLVTTCDIFCQEEAKETAIKIEILAYVDADAQYDREPGRNGISAVHLYGQVSNELMQEAIRKGPSVFVITERPTIKGSFTRRGPALIKEEEAKILLKPLAEPNNSFTKIHFSNRTFGIDAALVAERILVSLKDKLIEVDLSNFVARTSKDEAIQVMKIFSVALEGCALKSLDLSNNDMGEEGVRAFESLLKSLSSLEKLYLMNVNISGEAARLVCEWVLPSTQKLKVLHFDEDMIGGEGAVAIAKVVKCSPDLEDFRCSSTLVGKDGGFALTEALGTCTNLKKLNLSGNMFDAAGIALRIALCKVVSLSGITEIYLSYMHLGDRFASDIANVLINNAPSLEVLDMAGNNITIGAVSELAACISSKEFLTRLNLSKNELKSEGVIMIGNALNGGHGQLKAVDLSFNKIRIDGAKVLAQTVVQMPKFELLNINGNYLSVESIDVVKEILKKTPVVLGPLDKNNLDGDDEWDSLKSLEVSRDD